MTRYYSLSIECLIGHSLQSFGAAKTDIRKNQKIICANEFSKPKIVQCERVNISKPVNPEQIKHKAGNSAVDSENVLVAEAALQGDHDVERLAKPNEACGFNAKTSKKQKMCHNIVRRSNRILIQNICQEDIEMRPRVEDSSDASPRIFLELSPSIHIQKSHFSLPREQFPEVDPTFSQGPIFPDVPSRIFRLPFVEFSLSGSFFRSHELIGKLSSAEACFGVVESSEDIFDSSSKNGFVIADTNQESGRNVKVEPANGVSDIEGQREHDVKSEDTESGVAERGFILRRCCKVIIKHFFLRSSSAYSRAVLPAVLCKTSNDL